MDDPVVAFHGNSPPSRKALSLTTSNQRQDFLRKCNDNPACHSEDTIGPLAGIVALERQTDLENAEAQQDQTDGANQAE